MKTVVTLILLSISCFGFSQKKNIIKPSGSAPIVDTVKTATVAGTVKQLEAMQAKDSTENKLVHFNEWRAQEFINIQRLQQQLNEKLFDLISNQARDEGNIVTRENLLGLDPKPNKDGSITIVVKKKGP